MAVLTVLALVLSGCAEQANSDKMDNSYTQIDQETDVDIEMSDTGPENINEESNPDEMADAIQPVPTLVIEINGKIFYADPEDNSSAQEFIEKLSSGPITVDMHDYGNFEKVGPLPWSLPSNDEQITTEPGDVILYQGDQITIYYDQNTWSFTRLAKIGNVTREELLEAFGDGDVTVSFYVEWSE